MCQYLSKVGKKIYTYNFYSYDKTDFLVAGLMNFIFIVFICSNIVYILLSYRDKLKQNNDPNDILTNDFELTDLMGPEGREQWKKYIALKGELANAKEKDEKFKIASEINKIGDLYNFSE